MSALLDDFVNAPDTMPMGEHMKSSRLLHLSDPHFGAHAPMVCADLVRLAHALKPDALIISGNLTQHATRQQFRRAADWLARLPLVPRLVLAGSHDISLLNLWCRLFDPYGRFTRCVNGELAPLLRLPQVLVLGVDTTRWWRRRQGTLSEAQIEQTARALRSEPKHHWRIVVTHHPLAVALERNHKDRAKGHAEALARWQEAGAHLLLSGHLHEPAWMHVGPACWTAQAGSACATRLQPGTANSVQLLSQRWTAKGCVRTVERWDHDPSARGGFTRAAVMGAGFAEVPER